MRILLITPWLLLHLFSCAQTTVSTTSKKAHKHFEKATDHIAQNQLTDAMEDLRRAIEEDAEFVDAYIYLGNLEFYHKDYANAEKHLAKAIALLPDHDSRPYWDLANLYLQTEQFEDAARMFDKYLSFEKVRSRSAAERLLAQARFAAEAVKNPLKFDPVNMGDAVNSPEHDYLPSLNADESILIFTTRLGGNDEDFFVCYRTVDGWQQSHNIGKPINNVGFNEGAQSISPDGMTLYFAADYTDPRLPQNFNLYSSKWNGRSWGIPKSLPGKINTRHYESQPFISADGQSLYFASRNPAGEGGKDIWVSYLEEDGTWGLPENLGSHINTPGDEEVPFIHPDNETLYFGSDGHPGMGGSDLYMCRRNADGTWGEPVNLGYPINTVANEGSLFVSSNGKTGYFASDKEGGFGGHDLYSFEIPEEIRPQRVTYVKATVSDIKTRKKLESSIELVDLASGTVIAAASSDPVSGEFLMTLPAGKDYGLNVSKDGYLFFSENFSLTLLPADSVFLIDVELSPIEVGERIILRNVFFDTDSYELLDASRAELDRVVALLNENPSLQVEIGGHTDNIGTAAHNEVLSANRAQAVVDYLVTHSISADRLTSRGYGFQEAIDDNTTEDGRARNRRTEIKIVRAGQ